MRSAELMAKSKGLEFVVEDETTATEAGICNLMSRQSEQMGLEVGATRAECEYENN
jgi:hypothetical protein